MCSMSLSAENIKIGMKEREREKDHNLFII